MFEPLKFQSVRSVEELSKLSDFTHPASVAADEKRKEWHFWGRNAIWKSLVLDNTKSKAEKLRRKYISVFQLVCPTCSLQVNADICMPISPLGQLWICKLNSFLLMCSQSLVPHAHCLHHLWLLSRQGHLTTQTLLILKNWSRFVASTVYVKSVACVLSNTKS